LFYKEEIFVIMGGRRNCGKTTELIKISNEEWLYIVCANKQRVQHVADTARRMEVDIPYPISVEELPLKRSPYIKQVLIDDIEDVFASFIGKPIYQATSSMDLENL
jgi:hypothetical protein